jgi:hypothetical protein
MSVPPVPMKPPVAARLPPVVKPAMAKPGAAPARVRKQFVIEDWQEASEGQKIVLWAKSGMGKSTLAAMAPGAVFIGVDDGGRKITDPRNGTRIRRVPGIETFDDIRDALHQSGLFPDKGTIVIDTITKVEPIIEPWIFANYKVKGGGTAKNMREYGWDGPAHNLDAIRLLLTDLDQHVRQGRNVILLAQLAQVKVANAEGLDYLEDGPKLQHNNQYSARTEVCEWADHVFRIGYSDFNVVREDVKAKAGKVQAGSTVRAVYTGGAQHFIAKSRPVNGYRIPDVIPFAEPKDDSLWQYVFEGARAAE